jgi:hypothetical protein
MHVHVYCGDGEAKFWLEPHIELANNFHWSRNQLKEIEGIIEVHYDELMRAWHRHFHHLSGNRTEPHISRRRRPRILSRAARQNTAGDLHLLFRVGAYSESYHLPLRTGSTPIATVIRRLLTGYAVTFNHRHGRIGQLFQNRYKSILFEEEPYLLELVRYIHLNPVRAGLVADLAALGRYPYAGHLVLIMGRKS